MTQPWAIVPDRWSPSSPTVLLIPVVVGGMVAPMETQALAIEFEEEPTGEVTAEVLAIPGCVQAGGTKDEARRRVVALALQVLADRVAHGEADPHALSVRFRDA